MRFFNRTIKVRFLERPNRFLVRCEHKGQPLSAFLPNPGRLQELLFPGCTLHLIKGNLSQNRRTIYTVVAVEREGQPIMLHTHLTNEVARYLLLKRKIPGLERARIVKTEVRAGRSRFDFLLRDAGKGIYLEVKSCTLVGEKLAMFPDAVTERGARHLKELAKLSEEGAGAAALFVVHWPFARFFLPDYHTDLNFAQTLLQVKDKIRIIPLSVHWRADLSLGPEVRLLDIPWGFIEKEVKDRGSYLLILKVEKAKRVNVGSLGNLFFRKGFYIYVGSAMANLSKRMERHRRLIKRHHWHIDELRRVAEFHACLAIRSSDRLECEVAGAISEIAEWEVPGFGSTDCLCETHLFGMASNPLESREFQKMLQSFRMDRLEIVNGNGDYPL